MKPTVGRIVHYIPAFKDGGGNFAAIITRVWHETEVDLLVVKSNSFSFEHSVTSGGDDIPGEYPKWIWPPRV